MADKSAGQITRSGAIHLLSFPKPLAKPSANILCLSFAWLCLWIVILKAAGGSVAGVVQDLHWCVLMFVYFEKPVQKLWWPELFWILISNLIFSNSNKGSRMMFIFLKESMDFKRLKNTAFEFTKRMRSFLLSGCHQHRHTMITLYF